MKQTVAPYNNFLTGALFDYVAELSALPEEISLRDELSLARHSISHIIRLYQETITNIPQDCNNPSQVIVSILAVADQLRAALKEVAQIGKTASEVELGYAARFNGLQIIHIVDQMSNIILKVLKNNLEPLAAQEISEEIKSAFQVELQHIINTKEPTGLTLDPSQDLYEMIHSVPDTDTNTINANKANKANNHPLLEGPHQ